MVLHVTEITGYTDWVLILSGRSDKHVAAITEGIANALRDSGLKPRGSDGFADHSWDLLDYDDFMIHTFYHPVRLHYDLESMWADAKRVDLELPNDVMDTSDLDALESTDAMPEFRGDIVFGGFEDEFEDDDDLEDDDLDEESLEDEGLEDDDFEDDDDFDHEPEDDEP